MEIELMNYTGLGRPDQVWHAADVMIFTKQTRLNLSAGLMEEIQFMHGLFQKMKK